MNESTMNESTMTAAVLTISDSVAHGKRVDVSGPDLVAALTAKGFKVVATKVVPDEQPQIEAAIRGLCVQARLVVTAGGTGIAKRDVTPEATRAICSRLIEGISERIRIAGTEHTPLAALSRGVCGVFRESIVVNVPGSPSAARKSLESVLEILPHALALLAGKTEHPEAGA